MAADLPQNGRVFFLHLEVIVVHHQLDVGIVHRLHPRQRFRGGVDDVGLFTTLGLDGDGYVSRPGLRAGAVSKIDQLLKRLCLRKSFGTWRAPLLPNTITRTPSRDTRSNALCKYA